MVLFFFGQRQHQTRVSPVTHIKRLLSLGVALYSLISLPKLQQKKFGGGGVIRDSHGDDHCRSSTSALPEGGWHPDDVGRWGPSRNQKLRFPDGEIRLQTPQRRYHIAPSFPFCLIFPNAFDFGMDFEKSHLILYGIFDFYGFCTARHFLLWTIMA